MKTPSPIKIRKQSYLSSTIAGLLAVFASVSAYAQGFSPGPNPMTGSSLPQTITSGTGEVPVGGDLEVSSDAIGMSPGASSCTITNAGYITADNGYAITLLSAGNDVYLTNIGIIQTLGMSSTGVAIDWSLMSGHANELYNNHDGFTFGDIISSSADAVRPGSNGVIENEGYIEAYASLTSDGMGHDVGTDSDGINVLNHTGVNITNTGNSIEGAKIVGRHGISGGDDTHAIDITITNQVADTYIFGSAGSGIYILGPYGHVGAVTYSHADIENEDEIAGGNGIMAERWVGDGIHVVGTATVVNYGDIEGDADGVDNDGKGIVMGGGSITNYGSISGGDLVTDVAGTGILVDDLHSGGAFTATEIISYGSIWGSEYAIHLIGDFDDSVTIGDHVSSASLTGNSDFGDGDDVVTIVGGSSTTAIVGNLDGGGGTDTLVFDQDTGETFTWNSSYAISNFEVLVKKGYGVLDLTGAGTLPTGMTIDVEAGTLIISYSQLDTLLGTTPKGLLDISSTNYHSGSPASGSVVISGGHGYLSQITGHLRDGYNIASGYWDGPAGSILSTRAATNDVYGQTTLGVADNYILGIGTFDGATVFPSDVLIKYTVYGDADLDGAVTDDIMDPDSDYSLFYYGLTSSPSPATWYYGDFDYSGAVDLSDFTLFFGGDTCQSDPR